MKTKGIESNDASVRAWSGELVSCERESCEQGALKVHFREFVSSRCFFIQKFTIFSNFVPYDRRSYNCDLGFNLGFGMAMNLWVPYIGLQIVNKYQTV